MTSLTEAVDRVLAAIDEPGPNPHFHDREWMSLMRNWPTLAAALINLGTVRKEETK